MHSLACLPSFPCLDAWPPTGQKRFHLGTAGDHHAFLGLLAFLPLLGCLAPYRPKTFSFRYRRRPSCIPWLPCLPSLASMLGSLQTKNVSFRCRRRPSCIPWVLAFLPLLSCLAPYRPKTFSFRYRKRNLLMIANFVNIGFQGTNTSHSQKHFQIRTERDNHAFLPLIPPVASFPYRPKFFILVQKETIIPSLACLPSFICLASLHYKRLHLCTEHRMIANFDNLGCQGFQGTNTPTHSNIFQQTPTHSITTTHSSIPTHSNQFQHIATLTTHSKIFRYTQNSQD